MRINQRQAVIAIATAATVIATSCGKSDSEEKSAGVEATSVAELKLSQALKISLPAAIANAASSGTTLALTTTGKKSAEACRTMSTVKDLFNTLGGISSMLCHFEAESSRIQFGKKYKIALTEGGQEMDLRVWIDNSTAGKLTMYTCQEDVLTQKIDITESNSTGAKGTVVHRGSFDGATYANSTDFNFLAAGAKVISGSMTYSMGSDSFSNKVSADLKDSGVSSFLMANRGSWGGSVFADRGAVFHNGNLGQALFKGEGTFQSQTYQFSSRATFNSDGIKIANSEATSDITVAASSLPDFLATDFSIDPPTGWDCAAEETLSVNIDTGDTGAAHQACDAGSSSESTDCWGEGFEAGDQEDI